MGRHAALELYSVKNTEEFSYFSSTYTIFSSFGAFLSHFHSFFINFLEEIFPYWCIIKYIIN